LERGTLTLASIKLLVLDEADEMLRMGFLEAVEAILLKTPPNRQAALFSATLPAPIRRIAQKHLRSPVEVTIQSKAGTAPNVRQRYWLVSGLRSSRLGDSPRRRSTAISRSRSANAPSRG
jgi:ATP-dependent RNA helicase DeaD